jgi:hypothetical protein
MSIISQPSINYFSSFKFKGCHILNCRELISDIKFKKKPAMNIYDQLHLRSS